MFGFGRIAEEWAGVEWGRLLAAADLVSASFRCYLVE
jgi:hypothetical protein